MIDLLLDLVGFAARAFVVVVAISTVVLLIASVVRRSRGTPSDGVLRVTALNERIRDLSMTLRHAGLPRKQRKVSRKALKAEAEAEARRPKTYVLDFDGDVSASSTDELRRCVTAIVEACDDDAQVVVRLESSGGTVPGYGLGASQLQRLRTRGVHVTVCVDRVAASGGYMMAAVANEVVAAPFAVLGSIGVIMPAPNVHRWLEERGIDYEEWTAGEHKRTYSFAAEITPEAKEKAMSQLEDAHTLFKHHIQSLRPQLDLDVVATGEHWYGTRALELGLADRLATSDDVLLQHARDRDLLHVAFDEPVPLRKRVMDAVSLALPKRRRAAL